MPDDTKQPDARSDLSVLEWKTGGDMACDAKTLNVEVAHWPMSGPDWRQRRRRSSGKATVKWQRSGDGFAASVTQFAVNDDSGQAERQRTLALAACDGDIGPALDAVYEQVERDHDEQKR